MKKEPSSNGPVIAPIVLALLLLLGGYGGGYFWLGERSDIATAPMQANAPGKVVMRLRTYRWQWLATGFWPMAKLEETITGLTVEVSVPYDLPM